MFGISVCNGTLSLFQKDKCRWVGLLADNDQGGFTSGSTPTIFLRKEKHTPRDSPKCFVVSVSSFTIASQNSISTRVIICDWSLLLGAGQQVEWNGDELVKATAAAARRSICLLYLDN